MNEPTVPDAANRTGGREDAREGAAALSSAQEAGRADQAEQSGQAQRGEQLRPETAEVSPGETADSAPDVTADAPLEDRARIDAHMAAREAAPVRQRDQVTMQVERVLEADLWEVYVTLPDAARQAFKRLGEETAVKIRGLLLAAKVRAGRIHHLVHRWLSRIPGVYEFFLLQESKIKTDGFVKLAERIKQKG